MLTTVETEMLTTVGVIDGGFDDPAGSGKVRFLSTRRSIRLKGLVSLAAWAVQHKFLYQVEAKGIEYWIWQLGRYIIVHISSSLRRAISHLPD
jgi:hypothetical protein